MKEQREACADRRAGKAGRILSLALLFAAFFAFAAYGGQFRSDETGIWYENDDGSYPTGWFEDADGSWYLFDENGYARKGWFEDNGVWYYLGKQDGRMFADCVSWLEGGFYRFDSNGSYSQVSSDYSGWLWDGTYWFYRRPNGSYAMDGWRDIDGERYYFSEGHLLTGPAEIDGTSYFFDEKGHSVQGLVYWQKNYYYVNEDASLVKGEEREIDGMIYTFDENGVGTARAAEPPQETETASDADWPYKAISYIPPEDEKSELHKTCDRMADQILAGIVNDNMNNRQKAEAIYAWVRGSLRYGGSSATRDWIQEAYNGLRRRSGDCFNYYSVSQLLLSRVGIASIEVVRYTDNHHYWNLVNIDGSWYHFDACPRRAGGYFCLWTDAQMLAYSRKHGNCFAFDQSLYPRTP